MMWPDNKRAWAAEYAADAARKARGRLHRYPVLRGFESGLVDQGGSRAAEICEYLAQYPGYFQTGRHFARWLDAVHYREALRLVYPVEPVEWALGKLSENDRRVIRLRYVDQLSDEEVGRVLELWVPAPHRAAVDLVAAARASAAAYRALCAALPPTADALRPGVTVTAVFPVYPGGPLIPPPGSNS